MTKPANYWKAAKELAETKAKRRKAGDAARQLSRKICDPGECDEGGTEEDK